MAGPSKEWLKHMKAMLPSLAKGVAEKRTIGKGRKALLVRKAQKACSYCTKLYDFKLFKDEESPKLEVATCPECQGKLNDGYTAIVAEGGRLCFVKSERLKELSGQCVRVSVANFEKIKAEYDANWKPAPDKKLTKHQQELLDSFMDDVEPKQPPPDPA